jgi:hypothetical protein
MRPVTIALRTIVALAMRAAMPLAFAAMPVATPLITMALITMPLVTMALIAAPATAVPRMAAFT